MKLNKTISWSGVRWLLSPGVAIILIGCGKDEINVYSVPKEVARVASSSHDDHDSHPVHWTTPAGWKELAPTSMRVGNFLISQGDKKAEVSIIPFPGRVGGALGSEVENINRWRGEIGADPVSENEGSNEQVAIGRGNGKFYDFVGPELSTLVAVLEKGDTSWFFKMRGDNEIVASSKSTFAEFLKSITFHSDDEIEQEVAATPVSTNVEEVPDETSNGEPKWKVPATWQEKPATPMVLKNFSVIDGDREAKIAISVFPGEVGGLLANVNRWRNQLSLKPVTAAELPALTTTIDVAGGAATLVDMKGPNARMVAASVPQDGRTWFYKMTGDSDLIEREKEAFVQFVKTVEQPND